MKEMLGDLWTKDFAKGKLDKLIAISNLILDGCPDEAISDKEYTYTYEEKKCEYDPDSSSIAWAYYETMYKDKIHIEKEIIVNSKGTPTRVLRSFGYEEQQFKQEQVEDSIELAGDCVFNFKKGGATDKSIGFDDIITREKDENKQKNLKSKLERCSTMHHSPYNFSLMPVTGGMNNVKARQHEDRIDILLYVIKENYENKEKIKDLENNQIFQQSNKLYADHFLTTIGSFENYVRIFYHLDYNNPIDKSLIEAMLALGEKAFYDREEGKKVSADALEAYMNLAIAYWQVQRSKYEKLKAEKNLSEEEKWEIDELLKSVISYCKDPS